MTVSDRLGNPPSPPPPPLLPNAIATAAVIVPSPPPPPSCHRHRRTGSRAATAAVQERQSSQPAVPAAKQLPRREPTGEQPPRCHQPIRQQTADSGQQAAAGRSAVCNVQPCLTATDGGRRGLSCEEAVSGAARGSASTPWRRGTPQVTDYWCECERNGVVPSVLKYYKYIVPVVMLECGTVCRCLH